MEHPSASPRCQTGSVLFLAIVFLLISSLLAVAASHGSLLQEKSTAGLRNIGMASFGAESAVRAGEYRVWSAALNSKLSAGGVALPCDATGSAGCYLSQNNTLAPEVQSFRSYESWTAAAASSTFTSYPHGLSATSQATAKLAAEPRYIVEQLGAARPANVAGRMGGGRLQENGALAGDLTFYRITGMSPGALTNATDLSESVYLAQKVTNIDP